MAKRNNNIFSRSERENKASVARSEAYAESVRRMFSQTVTDILETLKMYPDITDGEMFSFDAQSIRVQKEVERLLRRLSASVTLATEEDIKIEWGLANDSVDALIESVVGKKVLRDPNFKSWTNRNAQAMNAFISRKHGIMTLKDRIWQTTQQLREEMEVALTVSIGEGKSAAQMSREVKKYLNDPDLMFRRFRYKIGEDEEGNPVYGRKWKKLVKDDDGRKHWIDYDKDSYKVGRGMYKSATKNAMRVTRTETNMAYRRSDQTRWRNLDFIVGYHIEPSHSHEPGDCEPDICEQLKGDYPKDFVWSGFHPSCCCVSTPILMDEDEFIKMQKARARGEEYKSPKQITDYPEGFKQWCRENEDKIKDARKRGKEPYFVRDNIKVVKDAIKGEE